jgi:hypothetical protein
MLSITLDLLTGKATLAAGSTVLAGVSVPVRINCVRAGVAASPGESPAFELAIGTDSAPASILAYMDEFSTENESTFEGILSANDSRLVDYMASKSNTGVKAELRWTVGGVTLAASHFGVTVEPPIITPGAATEGGPEWLTLAAADALYAQLGVSLIPDRRTPGTFVRFVIDADGNFNTEPV